MPRFLLRLNSNERNAQLIGFPPFPLRSGGIPAVNGSVRSSLAHHLSVNAWHGGYEKALDEDAFALFNCIGALKVLEAHKRFPEIISIQNTCLLIAIFLGVYQEGRGLYV